MRKVVVVMNPWAKGRFLECGFISHPVWFVLIFQRALGASLSSLEAITETKLYDLLGAVSRLYRLLV